MRRWSPTAIRAWQVRVTAEGMIRADRERLETALDALMENAVNVTDEGDAIRVGCRGERDVLALEISDDGRGDPRRRPPRDLRTLLKDRVGSIEAERRDGPRIVHRESDR